MFFYPMKAKSEADSWGRRLLADFAAIANAGQPRRAHTVQSVHTDNGGELVSGRFFELCDTAAVSRTFAPAYVHQLNGVAERAIGIVCQGIRTLLLASHADVKYWAYAGAATVDHHNCIPATHGTLVANPHLSPQRRLNGTTPNLLTLLPFGCAAIATADPAHVHKSTHAP